MTPEPHREPLDNQAPPTPSLGRTALAFVVTAVVLLAMALGYRAMGRQAQTGEAGLAHCLKGDYWAATGIRRLAFDEKADGMAWQKAESEYRRALVASPRLSRARRGLAAVLWLRGDRQGAKQIASAPVDIPDARADVWRATQAAYGAIDAPADATTRARYRAALSADDLGWSRFVALQALATNEKEAAIAFSDLKAAYPSRRSHHALIGLGVLFGLIGGIFVLINFLSRPQADHLARTAAPSSTLAAACLMGLAAESLVAALVRLVFDRYFSGAHDGAYFAVALLMHVAGGAAAFWLGNVLLRGQGSSLRELGWSWRRAPAWAVGGYLALAPLVYAADRVSSAVARLLPHVETPMNAATWMVAAAHGWNLVFVFLAVCIVGPFIEEVLFRGFLFRALMGPFRFWGAAILSSAVFASLHPQLPLGFLSIWLIGMALCVVYRGTGSLTACWLCHALNNTVALTITLTMYSFGGPA